MPNYEFDVLVHGKSVIKYRHEGRVYIEGRASSEFTLLVRNNTGSRILAVMTVDGLSVMDGKKGSIESSGYVLNAWETLKVPGWRLNDDSVAKFTFSGKGKSYAASKGEQRNIGVIGCAVFEELRPAHIITPFSVSTHICDCGPLRSRGSTGSSGFYTDCNPHATTTADWSATTTSTNGSADIIEECSDERLYGPMGSDEEYTSGGVKTASSVTRGKPVQNLGTSFGKESSHRVTEVTFRRKDAPTEVFSLHYDDRSGLKSRGIDVDRKVHVANPFPKDSEKGCEPPSGWRG